MPLLQVNLLDADTKINYLVPLVFSTATAVFAGMVVWSKCSKSNGAEEKARRVCVRLVGP
jgi:hypothetical protein